MPSDTGLHASLTSAAGRGRRRERGKGLVNHHRTMEKGEKVPWLLALLHPYLEKVDGLWFTEEGELRFVESEGEGV